MPDSYSNVITDIKISELPVADQANADDQLEANQSGTTRSITLDQVSSLVAGSAQIADVTTAYVTNVAALAVDTLADLKALAANAATTVTMNMVNTTCRVGGGTFRWLAGNQTQKIQDQKYDTYNPAGTPDATLPAVECMWVAPTASPTGSAGVWERILDNNQIDIGTTGIFGEFVDVLNGGVPTLGNGTNTADKLNPTGYSGWILQWRAIISICWKYGFELTIPGGLVYHLHSSGTIGHLGPGIVGSLSIRGIGKPPLLYHLAESSDSDQEIIWVGSTDPAPVTPTLAATILPNRKRITFTSTAGLKRGHVIRIGSNLLWPYDSRGYNYHGEMQYISDVAGSQSPLPANTIEIAKQTWDKYDPVANTITVTASTYGHVAIRNVDFYQSPKTTGDLTNGGACVQLIRILNARVENCRMRSNSGTTLVMQACYDPVVRDVWINFDQSYTMHDTTSYGFSIYSCSGLRMFNVHVRNCRRGIDISAQSGPTAGGPTRDVIVDGFSIWGGGHTNGPSLEYFEPYDGGTWQSFGVGTHTSDLLTFKNGTISGVGSAGINTRGTRTTIQNVDFYGYMRRATGSGGCVAASTGTGLHISDCSYNRGDMGFGQDDYNDWDHQAWCFLELGGGSSTISPPWKGDLMTTVSNIQCDGLSRAFVKFIPQATNDDTGTAVSVTTTGLFKNLHFSDIKVKPSPDDVQIFYFFDVDESDIVTPSTTLVPRVSINGSAMGIHLVRWSTGSAASVGLIASMYHPSIHLGSTATSNGSLVGWWIADRTVVVTLPKAPAPTGPFDSGIIQGMILDKRCVTLTVSGRVVVLDGTSIDPVDANLCGQFTLIPNNVTLVSQGTVGSLLTADAINGKVRLHLVKNVDNNYLLIENRMLVDVELTVTIT